MILRYNRIYPLSTAKLGKNTESIVWTPLLFSDAETAEPIREKGLDPENDRTEIARLIQAVPSADCYFTFYVYTDSFEAFRNIKETVAQAGYQFGWEPVQPSARLIFGKDGHAPPPL